MFASRVRNTQMAHWQFNSLRHAQYSTRMILNHIHNKPSYCTDNCSRGRVEDGSFMVRIKPITDYHYT